MCGIVGQLRPLGQVVSPELPPRMCAGLEHRGPDSRGIFREEHAFLGIQRLRVIDLSTGDQPIYNEDRSVVVVLNGEIYNYRELRTELRARGHEFATDGDTETIVHAYEEYGVACVRHLHGMFAFALWDKRRQQLLIARDRVGKKPLVYALRDGVLSFASEMGALLADAQVPREVDPVALDRYLALGYVPAPLTVFRGVRKLPPAHTLVLRDGEVTIDRYWKLDYSRKLENVPVEEICERVRAGLRTATRRRMISDVPLGAFLSGGIDSSAVVAAMAESSSAPVRTFAIGFDHAAFDELPYARQIARQFGTVHEEFEVRADAVEILPKIVRHYGEPFADSSAIPSFYLAQMTRRHVTVALNGDGGDESFGGYQRYVANAVAGRLDRIPAPARRAITAAGRRLPSGGAIESVTNKARRLTGTLALDGAARYAQYMSWFEISHRRDVYAPAFAQETGLGDDEVIAEAWAQSSGEHVVDRMLEVDVGTYLAGDLIPKIDIATMAYGLEARSPLLDHEFMELAASIPASLKVKGREKKWILREAMRGWLPDDILDRPKRGFTVPMSAWLRGDLQSWSREILLDRSTLDRGYFEPSAVRRLLDRHDGGADGEAPRIWSLVMLELWHREYVDAASGGADGGRSLIAMSAHVDTVIVSYQSRHTLPACVEPLLEMPGVTVTVVDNASSDGSLEVLQGLALCAIQSGRNGGFAFGCNLGTATGDAPYVLFLNPDARIERDDLQQLCAVLDAETEVSVVGPRLLDGTGALIPNLRTGQRASTIWSQALFVHRVLPRARWANEIDRSLPAHDQVAYPEWVSGACMLVRRTALEQIGGFDEGFFLYGEDMDLCYRLRAAGGRVRYEPGATVRHREGQSAERTSLYAVLARSRARYARKHSGRLSAAWQQLGLAVEALTHVIANARRPAQARGRADALRAMLRRDRAAAAAPGRAGLGPGRT